MMEGGKQLGALEEQKEAHEMGTQRKVAQGEGGEVNRGPWFIFKIQCRATGYDRSS